MTTSTIISLVIYCYIAGITPGPANLCSLSSAIHYGRKPALKQWRGLFLGFFIVSMAAVAVTYFLGAVLEGYTKILSYIGAAYILWMAWHIFRSSAQTESDEKRADYPSFRRGLLIQLTNVKIMICCLTALTAYVLPYTKNFWVLLAVGIFLPFTGPLANLVWLFAGVSMQKLLSKHRKVVDIVLALSLALCAVSLVWPHGG